MLVRSIYTQINSIKVALKSQHVRNLVNMLKKNAKIISKM